MFEDEKLYLVCLGCGGAFDTITTAYEHTKEQIVNTGRLNNCAGNNDWEILPESEAM